MILDKKLQLALATAVPTSIGTHIVGDVLDFKDRSRIGDGNPLYLVIQVAVSFASGSSSAQVEFELQTGANSALGRSVGSTGSINVTALKKATQRVLSIPSSVTYDRYVGLSAKPSAVLTAGAISAFIIDTPPADWYAVQDAQN